jgi:hypothetical protein
MANLIQKAFGERNVRQIPISFLMLMAKIGDVAKFCGMNNPPLTSFRLSNLLTEMVYDLEPLQKIVGELPFSLEDGVVNTVDWMRGTH